MYNIIKLLKNKHKEKILKIARQKWHITYLMTDFSSEAMEAKKKWETFKC